ncbi:MAG: hypothetical protein KGZ81_03670 [Flavobacteriales bacterium]|nr:hypothetical protein [Flavobacteriales bacterium]
MKTILYILLFTFSLISFSQTKKEPIWWEMERNEQYLEVASYLLFKVQSDSTRNKHADYLHIARAYGYLNDYEKAIFYWKKCAEDLKPENDEQFWWYYSGTLAFFQRDKNELKKNLDKLEVNHSQYYENNYKTLKSLYEKFDKGYKEASNWKS